MIKSASQTKNAGVKIQRTKQNKIRRIEKELKKNPNNQKAKERLAFWQSK
jgi:low affinity Fe/Cu permease